MTRRLWVLIHRWAGLAMAAFLILVGLTGSLLAFYPELERLINPQYYPARGSGEPLGPGELAERVEQRVPEAWVNAVVLEANQGATLVSVGPRPNGKAAPLKFNNLFLDPYTGEELYRRQFGAISEGWTNFMGFIYQLHYNLAAGTWGTWILGICALVWTIDCFVGFYLTFPPRRRKGFRPPPPPPPSARGQGREFRPFPCASGRGLKGWWQRRKPAWTIRWRAGGYKLNFDLHRAGSLWFWAMLFVFAWSSVYMNLGDTVYTWTTQAVTEYKAPWTEMAPREEPLQEPKLTWRQAQAVGERLMAEQAELHGFTVDRPIELRLDREHGVYNYVARSSRDLQDKRGSTRTFFDADTGELKLLLLPTGQYAGNTITSWLVALHEANVFGLPYRIFVCVLGIAITMLAVTGIIIWLRKRRTRTVRAAAPRIAPSTTAATERARS